MSDCINKLRNFLDGSDSFNGITFQGIYTMKTESFLKMFNRFLETGENTLDEYSEINWLSWGSGKSCHDGFIGFEYFDKKERKTIRTYLKGNSFWDIKTLLSADRLKEIREALVLSEAHDINSTLYKERRKIASRYISKDDVRKEVFDKNGRECAECGCSINLKIDHIVPVVKGGGNEMHNLQVLCKTCNASKGASLSEE